MNSEGAASCLSVKHSLRKSEMRSAMQKAQGNLEKARAKWLNDVKMENAKVEVLKATVSLEQKTEVSSSRMSTTSS